MSVAEAGFEFADRCLDRAVEVVALAEVDSGTHRDQFVDVAGVAVDLAVDCLGSVVALATVSEVAAVAHEAEVGTVPEVGFHFADCFLNWEVEVVTVIAIAFVVVDLDVDPGVHFGVVRFDVVVGAVLFGVDVGCPYFGVADYVVDFGVYVDVVPLGVLELAVFRFHIVVGFGGWLRLVGFGVVGFDVAYFLVVRFGVVLYVAAVVDFVVEVVHHVVQYDTLVSMFA